MTNQNSRTYLYLALAFVACLVVGILIAVSSSKAENKPGLTDTVGIPEKAAVLGNDNAPVTLEEFGDLQCPYCGQFSRNTLPTILKDYVKTGKVRLVFHGIAFVGPDSKKALQAAEAAALQNKLWGFIENFYNNQKAENTGYVTDSFLRKVGKLTAGLDVDKLMEDRTSNEVQLAIARNQSLADSLKVTSTPSFLLYKTGQTPKPLLVKALDINAFRDPIENLLAS